MKKKLLISACLLGETVRYDGKSKPCDRINELSERYELIAVCPEVLGGLPTPRTPSERLGDRVIMRDGADVTQSFQRGALRALEIFKSEECAFALLKARSPSCGRDLIYDGSFTASLREGNGVCAELLLNNGIKVFTEEELDILLSLA